MPAEDTALLVTPDYVGAIVAYLRGPDREWVERAKCRELELPIPERLRMFFLDNNYPSRYGKEVCHGCPVKVECREYARQTDTQYGIWGEEVLRRYDPGDVIVVVPIEVIEVRELTPAERLVTLMNEQFNQRVWGIAS